MISIYDNTQLRDYCRVNRIDPYNLNLLHNAFCKKSLTSNGAIAILPQQHRDHFAHHVQFHTLTLAAQYESAFDGATKLIFHTRSGLAIESVILRIATGRTTLCLSSQIGCAARCAFCATGTMPTVTNLSRDEILDQLIHANQLLVAESRRIRNIVFMGMGEPLHNEQNLYAALDTLLAPNIFDYSQKNITVSTVGIPDPMIRLAHRYPRIGIAGSLHTVRDSTRQRLMPISTRHSLAGLHTAMKQVTQIQQRKIMIEYLMLKGINDTPNDIEALSRYLHDIPAHINLIQFNPTDHAAHFIPTPDVDHAAFANALRSRNFTVTLRYSLGTDINAACGQLAATNTARD